ncbi:MAG TPA: hypothetical protein EYP10_01230, partial [Armatimonadetes bacterium]|nr:hypothetical protein [Armatimonadota bacterium]
MLKMIASSSHVKLITIIATIASLMLFMANSIAQPPRERELLPFPLDPSIRIYVGFIGTFINLESGEEEKLEFRAPVAWYAVNEDVKIKEFKERAFIQSLLPKGWELIESADDMVRMVLLIEDDEKRLAGVRLYDFKSKRFLAEVLADLGGKRIEARLDIEADIRYVQVMLYTKVTSIALYAQYVVLNESAGEWILQVIGYLFVPKCICRVSPSGGKERKG